MNDYSSVVRTKIKAAEQPDFTEIYSDVAKLIFFNFVMFFIMHFYP
jgi:hypothetical protein